MKIPSSPGPALLANAATITTTETIVHQIPLPANSLLPGQTYRIVAHGQSSGTTSPTITTRLRLGGAGTTADTQVCATPAAAMPTAATGWSLEAYMTVRSIGAAGAVLGNIVMLATAPSKSNQIANVAVDTTLARFLSLTLQGGGVPSITPVIAFSQVV